MKFCSHCGKEIMDEAVICLNCGCRAARKFTYTPHPKTETKTVNEQGETDLATWSKICGIASFFIGWFALGITAIVLACMSKDETNGVMCSSAKVGYVCGIISTALSLMLFIMLIGYIAYFSI